MMRRMTPHTLFRLGLATLATWVALALTPPQAQAATLQVTVHNADGQPATDTVVLVQPTASWPAQPLPPTAVVNQRDIRFVPFVTVVPVGGTVRFVNLDNFDHHVRSQPGGPLGSVAAAKDFEFRLPPARKGNNTSADLRLDVAGTVLIGCHLHNSMRGHLFVSPTPWFGVTDAQGRVRIEGLPDGQAELKLWHPDQLTDQPAQRVQVAGTQALEAKLNFSPRKRSPPPPPREAPKYE
jgi:plastocyanin